MSTPSHPKREHGPSTHPGGRRHYRDLWVGAANWLTGSCVEQPLEAPPSPTEVAAAATVAGSISGGRDGGSGGGRKFSAFCVNSNLLAAAAVPAPRCAGRMHRARVRGMGRTRGFSILLQVTMRQLRKGLGFHLLAALGQLEMSKQRIICCACSFKPPDAASLSPCFRPEVVPLMSLPRLLCGCQLLFPLVVETGTAVPTM